MNINAEDREGLCSRLEGKEALQTDLASVKLLRDYISYMFQNPSLGNAGVAIASTSN